MLETDWDDVRFVLAVARKGTLSGAARQLRVNHATVLRRVNGFENSLGVTIFDRTARGYKIAPHRRQLLDAMQVMEEAALGVERALVAARAPLTGLVRVTSTDSLCHSILPSVTARLMREAEGLSIDLISHNTRADLGRMDADIAVRPTQTLPLGLTGTKAGKMQFGVFAAPGRTTSWLGMSGPLESAAPAQWMADTVSEHEIVAWADSFVVLREMAAAGQGRAILPVVLGATDPRLVPLSGLIPPMDVDVWVASHSDMAEVPRIKAVREMLTSALSAELARLEKAA